QQHRPALYVPEGVRPGAAEPLSERGPPMARYFVAGATGFLGSHLVRLLTRAGHDVVAISRTGGEVDGSHVQALDVLDAAAVERIARGTDGAFLCTGKVSRRREDAEKLHELHVLGTRSPLAG